MVLQLLLLIQIFMNLSPISLEAGRWKIVNDTVMGGQSSSDIRNNLSGHLLFSGSVSVANNGGFCMIKKVLIKPTSNTVKICRITLKGDGKKYQVRLKKKLSDKESYVTSISTNGKLQYFDLKINSFQSQFRGQKLDMPPLQYQPIEEIGFLIGNQVAETFEISILKIEFI